MGRALRSTPTRIDVVPPSALATAAAGLLADSFVAFEQPSLSARAPHPVSGRDCDVTEDGAQYVGHTMIDWAGKGVYDPISRRLMFAGCGAGNNVPGGYVYNTHAIYDEAANVWSAIRAFRGTNQTTSANPIVHTYDNNAICLKARTFYKKQFSGENGATGPIQRFDLATSAWVSTIPAPSDVPGYAGNGGMDAIESRGAKGALWYVDVVTGFNDYALFEYDIATATGWTKLLPEGTFPALSPSGGAFVSYNPRAFNGAGGVLVAGGTKKAYTIRCDTNVVSPVAADAPTAIDLPSNGHLCRDPSGSGWLLFATDGFVYRCDGASWLKRAALPPPIATELGGMPMIVTPIDAYGVVHLVAQAGAVPHRAWLYKA